MKQHDESTILRRLLTGSAFSMANMCLAIVVGLVLSPYIIRTLGDRLYGMWALVGTLTGWYGMLDLGVSQAISRYITTSFSKGDKESVNSYASIGYLIFVAVGIAGMLISIGVSFFVRWLYPNMEDLDLMRLIIVILGVNFAITFPLRVFTGIINGCLRSDLTGRRNLIFRVLSAALTFLVLYFGGRLVALSLKATFLALVNTIVFYWMARAVFPELKLSPKSIHKEHFKPLFSYSFFTAFTQIMDVLKTRVNNVFVAVFITMEMVTHYTINTTLSAYGVRLMSNLTGWLTTWFTRLDSQGRTEDIRTHLIFGYKLSIYIANFLMFALICWSAPFIARWVGAEYLDIFDAMILSSIATGFILWTSVSVKFLQATAKHYYYSIIVTIDTIIYLTVLLNVLGKIGVVGIPLSTLIAASVSRVFLLPMTICRLIDMPFITYWGILLRFALRSAVCLIIPFFISSRLVVPEYKWLFLNGFICALCYLFSIFFLGFSKEERRKIWGKLKKKT